MIDYPSTFRAFRKIMCKIFGRFNLFFYLCSINNYNWYAYETHKDYDGGGAVGHRNLNCVCTE